MTVFSPHLPAARPSARFAKALLALILALSLIGGAGCSGTDAAEAAATTASQPASGNGASAGSAEAADANDGAQEGFDLAQLPAYTGSPYTVVADNVPDFADSPTDAGLEQYAPLDDLGRCGAAFAVVGTETMPTEKRGAIGMVKPSGWHTVRYDDLVDGKYLYNRCHLIGYQLSGENANVENLITGTRYLNVEGMLPFENEVADYVDTTGNHVLYRSTPVFVGDELVARGVHMEAKSLEDDGAGVCFNVFCYNVQPGVTIDYATGDSWRSQGEEAAGAEASSDAGADAASSASAAQSTAAAAAADAAQPSQSSATASQKAEATYVLNTNTGKFHLPGCSSVDRMSEANKQSFTGTRDEVLAMGYEPCKRCNP